MKATAILDQALETFRFLADEHGIASTQWALACAALASGDAGVAKQMFDQTIEASLERVDRCRALLMRGEAERALGDLVSAAKSFADAVALALDLGHRHLEAAAIHSAGDVLLMQAQPDEAASLYRRSLEVLRGLESKRVSGPAIGGLAATAAHAGDSGRAGELWGAFETFESEVGYQIGDHSRALYESALASCVGPEFEAARDRGRRWSLTEAIEAATRT